MEYYVPSKTHEDYFNAWENVSAYMLKGKGGGARQVGD